MLILTVVNECLGTMGEAPINALNDPHPYRPAAVSLLNTVDREFQARGWWFNREELTLQPSGTDSSIYLPGDAISVRVKGFPNYVQRGRRLYNTATGDFAFTADVTATVIRLVGFEDSPELYAAYVAAETIWRFQKRYDGDSQKTRELRDTKAEARIAAQAEETRQVQANLIDSNPRLTYIKSRIYDVRGRRFKGTS